MKFAILRKSKKMTQVELSKSLGISNRTISMWEKGHSIPRTKMIKKIAELLQVDSSEVLECFN